MRPVEIFVLEHALKYQMGNAVKALRGRGNKQTIVYNLSSPYICLMYLIHIFNGYLTSTYKTISTWDPAVLKILVDVFQDMYSREKFTSEKVLVPLILRARLLEIIVYAEKSLPPGFVLEKLDSYFPQPDESAWNDFAQKYSLKGKSLEWLMDTCKKSRQYVMNLVIKKKKLESDSKDLEGFVVTVRKLVERITTDLSKTIPQTGLEKVRPAPFFPQCCPSMSSSQHYLLPILSDEKLQLDPDTEQIIQTVMSKDHPISEKQLLRLLELQESIEHPLELDSLMDTL
ncbi:uncharacterized protein LOC8052364 [Ixodes scapularis]|uniref:uncharacterized protein LOC8052364 n=1 Tax=Ixodes scapularis TaxID=6945 RepID=UPI001C38225B|nr:uncharacterized protein LOC8052364 [Ixodes scapularis]